VRTGYLVFDLADPSDIPLISEPLFRGVKSKLTLVPVMNTEDLMKGLQLGRRRGVVGEPGTRMAWAAGLFEKFGRPTARGA